jgi:putative ABC transport system substrate-binding protein
LGGPAPAVAAKAATSSVPIVFGIPDDPVKLGLVPSLARPGGNLTGVYFLTGDLMSKRFDLMRMLVPGVSRVAVLLNPDNAARAEAQISEVQAIARTMGLRIQIMKVASRPEIETAFAALASQKPDAIFVAPDPFFTGHLTVLVGLAASHSIPVVYSVRDFVVAGGLMSYGTNIDDAVRQVGVYAGRILKGEKPADLPVLLPTRFELVLNLKTAKSLGLTVPPNLLALTDEVIE